MTQGGIVPHRPLRERAGCPWGGASVEWRARAMNQTLHRFTTDAGWDHPLDASLDSSQTLVLVFGPSEREPVQGAMDAVRATYPQSAILGCSTAGEIHGPEVRDGTLSVAVARFASTPLPRPGTQLDVIVTSGSLVVV